MSNESTKTALAKTGQRPAGNGGSPDLRVLLERQKGEIARALSGTALDPERFARIALTVVRQNRGLQRCRPESLLGSLMTAAQLGLEPGPLGEAHLVPFKDECTFIIGYEGLIKLAWQSGQLRHIDAADVRDNDHFRYRRGSDPVLEHEPALANRGDVRCYYAVATVTTGGFVCVVMSPEDVEAIRKRSPSAKAKESPWITDYDAMARKTCVRQLAKYLPKSTTINRALSADGSTRTSASDDIEDVATDWVDGELVDEPESTPDTETPADGSEGEQQ